MQGKEIASSGFQQACDCLADHQIHHAAQVIGNYRQCGFAFDLINATHKITAVSEYPSFQIAKGMFHDRTTQTHYLRVLI